jgi:hypothetical protein
VLLDFRFDPNRPFAAASSITHGMRSRIVGRPALRCAKFPTAFVLTAISATKANKAFCDAGTRLTRIPVPIFAITAIPDFRTRHTTPMFTPLSSQSAARVNGEFFRR